MGDLNSNQSNARTRVNDSRSQSNKYSQNPTESAYSNNPYDSHDSLQLKSKKEQVNSASPKTDKQNNTGLPDQLKQGIEQLSGYSMDDVKVHYNSNKPAQLQAHAYAQGTDIHIASGQEKHLPHEAWHVVQQKQGRVKPTLQITSSDKNAKTNINDDDSLEKEADIMGNKALNIAQDTSNTSKPTTQNSEKTVQLVPIYQKGKSFYQSDSWEGAGESEWRSKKAKEEWEDILKSFKELKEQYEKYTRLIKHIDEKEEYEENTEDALAVFNKYNEDTIVPYSKRTVTKKELDNSLLSYKNSVADLVPIVAEIKERNDILKILNFKIVKEEELGLDIPAGARAKDDDTFQDLKRKKDESVQRAQAQRQINRDNEKAEKEKLELAEKEKAERDKIEYEKIQAKEKTLEAERKEKQREADRQRNKEYQEKLKKEQEALAKQKEALALKKEKEEKDKAAVEEKAIENAVLAFTSSSHWSINKYHKSGGDSRIAFIRFGARKHGELHWHLKDNWEYKYDKSDLKIKNIEGSYREIYLKQEDLPDGLKDWVKKTVNAAAATNRQYKK